MVQNESFIETGNFQLTLRRHGVLRCPYHVDVITQEPLWVVDSDAVCHVATMLMRPGLVLQQSI